MTEIRELDEHLFDDFIRLFLRAYPGIGLQYDRDREKLRESMIKRRERKLAAYYGAFRDSTLVAVMRLHDFTMNLRGSIVPAGGLGGVAVDLTRKREHIAGDMVLWYLDHYRQQDYPMAVLWPFRPDFYRKMGFGYGGKKYRYRFAPTALPAGLPKGHIDYLTAADVPALARCYDRVQRRGNGLLGEDPLRWESLLTGPSRPEIIGYRQGDEVLGFMLFRFARGSADSFISNDLHVEEHFFESPQVLAELMGFLQTQRDQIRYIILDTPDPDFHHYLVDPRNNSDRLYPSVFHETNGAGIGVMYRVLDPAKAIAAVGEGGFADMSLKLGVKLLDEFYAPTNCSFTLQFEGGRASVVNDPTPELRISLRAADFSALLIGSVGFRSLHAYGLADISDPARVETLEKLFWYPQAPYCMTQF